MNVVIIGAGVVGVTTAWALHERGARVTLVEKEPDAACATSSGNAGIIAAAYSTPWAAPGMPLKVLKCLFQPASPIIYRPAFNLAQWRWAAQWFRECTLERYRINKERMQRVAFYSKSCLSEFRAKHSFDYGRSQGYLQLFRTPRDKEMAQPAIQMLVDRKVSHKQLSTAECLAIEPGLEWATAALASGLYLPEDEAGDCAAFTRQLRTLCEQDGVRFMFNTRAQALRYAGTRIAEVVVRDNEQHARTLPADAVVVAAGVQSAALLAPLGISIPIYPVKGYSTTLTIKDTAKAPRAALMDASFKVAITRLGSVVRVAGTAEISDSRLAVRKAAARTLIKVAQEWFPDVLNVNNARFWVGLRPMTPDGPPLLGHTPIHNLYINLGHGSTGWAMAMGSASVVADLVVGRAPEIDLTGLGLERLHA